MRLDKLTTKFHEALSDAQSLALGGDHAYIEPVHLLVAMLKQDDGPKALLQRAGANVPALRGALTQAIERLPKVEGAGGEVLDLKGEALTYEARESFLNPSFLALPQAAAWRDELVQLARALD